MNRKQIIEAGLELAGRKDLLSQGRTWLNLFLQRQYESYDWPWLIKTSSNLALTDGADLPDDYSRAKSAVLIDGSTELPLSTVTADEFDDMKKVDSNSGTPRYLYIDETERTVHPWPAPDRSYSYRLRYFYSPELLDPSPVDDSEDPYWGEVDDILVQAVYVRCLQYLDDSRYGEENKVLMELLSEAKLNTSDRRAGKQKIPLGKSYSNRFANRRRIY